eukprot:TRINITY_DN24480_c0_g1_i1.p1 TRINITY_DN24480_c0_g1~~TRINITY_DN24480_c0_g1_i1.p1  ORF type:complete len:1286 (-),score=241.02 TRINITY_DN24480_c0_g1_i1:227-3700(-)
MTKKKAVASVSFEDVSLELPSGERILEGVSGEFRAGRMCAIMGPSGAGKTSLMNVLCGKAAYGDAQGVVRFNGIEGDYADYKTVMGFVPQDDIVHEGLTVGEQIRYSADLRNPSETSKEKRKLIVEDVLNVMQLGNIQNSIVGSLEKRGISGGQRKRVSIALELAADPTMLFLDEPTSGLDASSSLSIVQSLKKLAQLGMTSVMVVHQPRFSLFSLFDDVLLLGKGGRTVYFGPPLGATAYFERIGFEALQSENPADWIMDIIAGEVPNTRIPQFQPEMLHDIWDANKHVVERSARAQEQAVMEIDDYEAMMDNLSREWPLISYMNAPSAMDPAREGVLRDVDLMRLLKIEAEEDDALEDIQQAVRQLMIRVVGPSQLVATKRELLDFLAGLQGVVAEDKEIATRTRFEDIRDVSRKGSASVRSARSTYSSRSNMSPMTTPRNAVEDLNDQRAARNASMKARPRMPPRIEEEESNRPQSGRVLRPEAQHAAAPVSEPDSLNGGRSDSDKRSEASHPPEICAGDLQPMPEDHSEASPAAVDDEPEEPQQAPLTPGTGETSDRGEAAVEMSMLPAVRSGGSLADSAMTSRGGKRPREFKVLLRKTEEAGLGVVFGSKDGDTLFVKSISDGRIRAWNDLNLNLQIKKHDYIVEVNGVRGSAQAVLEECQKDIQLEITVRTREHGKPRASVTNSGSSRNTGNSGSVTSTVPDEASPANSTLLGRVAPPPVAACSKEQPPLKLAPLPLGPRATGEPQPTKAERTPKVRVQNHFGDLGGSDLDDAEPLDTIIEISRPNLTRTKSFASTAAHLQRYAMEQKPPGFCRQLVLLIKRSCIQWWRNSKQRAIFLGVISGSAITLALLDTFVVKEAEWQVQPYLNLHTCMALLISVFCLNLFSADRPVFWRERASGLSVAAFYVSKTFVNMVDVVLQCFLLSAVYYMIRQPYVVFSVYFPPFLLASFASAGLGYTISTCLPPQHGPFVTAIAIFVSCGLLGHPLRVQTMADGGILELAMDILSITRWSVAYYFTNYLAVTDPSQFTSDPEALKMIAGIEAVYESPSLLPDHILGMRTEVVFLLGMGLTWHLVGFLRLYFSGHSHGHRRAAPWKQRWHRLQAASERLALRVLGEERVAALKGAKEGLERRMDSGMRGVGFRTGETDTVA